MTTLTNRAAYQPAVSFNRKPAIFTDERGEVRNAMQCLQKALQSHRRVDVDYNVSQARKHLQRAAMFAAKART